MPHAAAEISPPLAGTLEADVAIVGAATRALDRPRLARAGAAPAHRAARGARDRRGAERPQRRLPARLLGSLSRCARCSATARALQLAHASSAIVPAVRAFFAERRRGRLAAGGRHAQGRRDRGRGRGGRPLGRRGARAGCRGGGGAAGRRTRSARGSTRPTSAAASSSATAPPSSRRASRSPCGAPRSTRASDLRAHTGDAHRTRLGWRRPPASCAPARLVLALNAWGTGWPHGGRQTNFASAVVLTEPVPDLLEAIGWTGGEAIVDGRMLVHYFRTTPDGRVLMGSGSGRLGLGGRVGTGLFDDMAAQDRAHEGLRELLPALADGADRRALERSDRPLRRPAAVLRHRARDADPLRGGLLGKRRRAELARGPDPRVARARRRGRVDGAAARGTAAAQAAAGAVPLRGRRLVRWGTLAGEEALAAGRRPSRRSPCRGRDAAPAAHADRDAMSRALLVLLVRSRSPAAAVRIEPRPSERLEHGRARGGAAGRRARRLPPPRRDRPLEGGRRRRRPRRLLDAAEPQRAGRDQARQIGRAFRALAIPVERGPLERVLPHARDRRARLRPREARAGADRVPGSRATRRSKNASGRRRSCSRDAPPAGTNTVLVAHVKNLEETAAISIEEGELAVFEPLGGTRYRYLGRIPASAWPQLAEELGAGQLDPAGGAAVLDQVLLVVLLGRPEGRRRDDLGRDRTREAQPARAPSTPPRPPPARASG